ncbi:Hypothetical protein LUCI_0823 [Lucifera butyrica]|uniref:HTH cro/C1-type domain-containing protein n=1 Tax=Lucifera butyrica TaxID=1351585 RepID=A0A498R5Y2_9FIRM|nr:helix-turn-helix transcriptional regulator [Lucifera butyrica]VBB05613.1 Hypothetical protein LUCI_0823 [Lucifera butyrica]
MISERLKELREKSGLNQSQAAEKLGISRVNYNRYENGEREPDNATLSRLANFFGVTTDYLLGLIDSPTEAAKTTIRSAISDDPELLEFWKELEEREDLKLFFRQIKSLSPQALKRIIRYIKIVEEEEAQEDL